MTKVVLDMKQALSAMTNEMLLDFSRHKLDNLRNEAISKHLPCVVYGTVNARRIDPVTWITVQRSTPLMEREFTTEQINNGAYPASLMNVHFVTEESKKVWTTLEHGTPVQLFAIAAHHSGTSVAISHNTRFGAVPLPLSRGSTHIFVLKSICAPICCFAFCTMTKTKPFISSDVANRLIHRMCWIIRPKSIARTSCFALRN